MTSTVRTEVRKRGFFGWFFLILFWLFNGLMVWSIISAGAAISENRPFGEAERVGAAIGAGLGFGMILFVWLAGAVILGLFVILTRGRKTIITEREA
jgi:hypothetical protein